MPYNFVSAVGGCHLYKLGMQQIISLCLVTCDNKIFQSKWGMAQCTSAWCPIACETYTYFEKPSVGYPAPDLPQCSFSWLFLKIKHDSWWKYEITTGFSLPNLK